jgi:hypothetical protein
VVTGHTKAIIKARIANATGTCGQNGCGEEQTTD